MHQHETAFSSQDLAERCCQAMRYCYNVNRTQALQAIYTPWLVSNVLKAIRHQPTRSTTEDSITSPSVDVPGLFVDWISKNDNLTLFSILFKGNLQQPIIDNMWKQVHITNMSLVQRYLTGITNIAQADMHTQSELMRTEAELSEKSIRMVASRSANLKYTARQNIQSRSWSMAKLIQKMDGRRWAALSWQVLVAWWPHQSWSS